MGGLNPLEQEIPNLEISCKALIDATPGPLFF